MKKILFSIIAFLLVTTNVFAQSPLSFKYQAVARDASGNVLQNQAVGIQISILQGSESGTSVYTETHSKTTNDFGLINLEIGKGTVISGTFSAIAWGTSSYFVQIEMDATGGTNYQLLGTSQLLSVPYSLYAENAGNGSSQWSQSGDNIYFNDGNVGIGIDNPIHPFHVKLGTDKNIWFREDVGMASITTANDEANAQIPMLLQGKHILLAGDNIGFGTLDPKPYSYANGKTFEMKGANPSILFNDIDGNDTDNFEIVNSGSWAQFVNATDGGAIMTLGLQQYPGNVGIGTTNLTHKLSVGGTIRAYEVIVNTGWADFVFESDYRLPKLMDVETFIKKNGHLPNIPSAKEVEEKGVSLGTMDSKLLQKIEELTLYTIEQDKLIKNLIERIEKLEKSKN